MTYVDPTQRRTTRDRGLAPTARPVPLHVAWRYPVVAIWLAWSIGLILVSLPLVAAFRTQDPDDFLRLMEVRDLLAGQSWYDVTQYRMNPPVGGQMHWSRLVDVPIAAVLLVARALFAEPLASKLTMTIVPLGQLLLVMALLVRLMAVLGADRYQRLVAAAIVPLLPLAITCFMPMRIDHHGWQAIGALSCALFFVRAPDPRAALFGGAIAAFWLSVSLEGLPFVVLFAALYGLRFLLLRERDLAWFLTGLAGASIPVHLVTRPSTELLPHCDSVGWPHLAAFAVAALMAQAATRYRGGDGAAARTVRLALLVAIGGVAGALIVLPIGPCAINPFATIDPVMERYWHGAIAEGLPVTAQLLSVQMALWWAPLIVFAAIFLGLPDRQRPLAERPWLWLGLLVFGATPISLLVMREGVNVEVLVAPFSALLIARYLPRARAIRRTLPRAIATVAVPILATPVLASAAATPFNTRHRDTNSGFAAFAPARTGADAACDPATLAKLPASRLFATLDLGPEILVKSPHAVVASGYHRNMAKMREVVEVFSGDPARARAIVRANHSRYVVLCLDDSDTAVFRSRRQDNLANNLATGSIPTWLKPVTPFDRGELRAYRVD